jgi:hypothetical protein
MMWSPLGDLAKKLRDTVFAPDVSRSAAAIETAVTDGGRSRGSRHKKEQPYQQRRNSQSYRSSPNSTAITIIGKDNDGGE